MIDTSGNTGSLSPDQLRPPLNQPDYPTSSLLCNGSVQNKTVRFGSLEPAHLTLLKHSTLPLVSVLTLAICMLLGR